MHSPTWNAGLQHAAKRRAAELRQEAMDAAWDAARRAMTRTLRRLARAPRQPEA